MPKGTLQVYPFRFKFRFSPGHEPFFLGRYKARRFPLPDGSGQVKRPVGQVDLDRFFFFIWYKQIEEFQISWSRASDDFEKRRALRYLWRPWLSQCRVKCPLHHRVDFGWCAFYIISNNRSTIKHTKYQIYGIYIVAIFTPINMMFNYYDVGISKNTKNINKYSEHWVSLIGRFADRCLSGTHVKFEAEIGCTWIDELIRNSPPVIVSIDFVDFRSGNNVFGEFVISYDPCS